MTAPEPPVTVDDLARALDAAAAHPNGAPNAVQKRLAERMWGHLADAKGWAR